ncbi:hypothetical protein [Sulfolobus acidocaldarius]|uniref:Uncharacterized protein n=4 Tax=Sulfolobus acidocaldarius TaxID=2285 RepID=Q4JA20_SULAC|nr:hypothetical protein [Sulfolobus acidocaldarius]AAY80360.1 hypothetical protein Saci_1002 [Sulfolobus acidocaldarius DSM 639]AGE70943.1 hypothetical protein SacN8_04860 [Sulfolobus acidocaldarius N8]AGE73214.1 hypothetical protein SacRon12I_04850 [Sulfolobus acidocaldarius Ron12/I]ALU28752.1 hypothetical protein ATY89_01445 [Sulfolobus acidocaldarius]ALU31472.1 hypothetical protein ATZ20_04480 [Sulfolobus acidocaldarius]
MKFVSIFLILHILIGTIAPVLTTGSSLNPPPEWLAQAVNTQINQLWAKSPTGLYAFKEAQTANNSFWLDDQAKFLQSIAPYWQSYSTYVSPILQFLQQGDINGLFIKRFEYPSLQNLGTDTWTNGFEILRGNPLSENFSVSTYYNPTLPLAFLSPIIIQLPDGVLVNVNQDMENIVIDGGFGGSGGQNPPWISFNGTVANGSIVTLIKSAKTYLNLTGPTFFGTPSENLYVNFPIINRLQSPYPIQFMNGLGGQYNYQQKFVPINFTILVQGHGFFYFTFIWAPNVHGYPGNTLYASFVPVYVNSNTWTQITIPILQQEVPEVVATTLPIFLVGVGFIVSSAGTSVSGTFPSRTKPSVVYIADLSTNVPTTYSPQFSITQEDNSVVYNESWKSDYYGVTFWYAWILNDSNALIGLGYIPLANSTIYVPFNQLSTLSTGYTELVTQNQGLIKNYQDISNVSWSYFTNVNIGKWMLLSTNYAPNWIGELQLLFVFPGASTSSQYINVLGHSAYGGDPYQVRNTLYFNSTFSTPPGMYQWVQVAYRAPNSSWYFTFDLYPSVDYIPDPNNVVNLLLNVPTYYEYADLGMNYYEGEIIYALALLGEYGNSQALQMAEQAWSAYYSLLQKYNGQTYTSSLALFILATEVLYQVTGSPEYSSALDQLGSWLLQYQNVSRYAYYYFPMWYHKINTGLDVNGFNSYGLIINQSSNMGVGYVMSGTQIRVNFFEDIPLNTSYAIYLLDKGTLPFTYQNTLNVSGTFTTTLWMNAQTAGTLANITVTVQIANNGNVLQTIGSGTLTNVQLGGGAGSPPFYPVTLKFPVLTTINAPPNSTLIVGLNIKGTNTVYVLVDSTNGPSNVTIPLSWKNPFYGEFTLPEIENPNPAVKNYPQPYLLDAGALSGLALVTLYKTTGNTTYMQRAQLVMNSIHYGPVPESGYQVLGINTFQANRLWVYASYSTVDADAYTYKSELTAEFALAVGNYTVASLALTDVWWRTVCNYSGFLAFYVGNNQRSDFQINSETQPWGVATIESLSAINDTLYPYYISNLGNFNYMTNMQWNGTALIIDIYMHSDNSTTLYFHTIYDRFNILVNGQYVKYARSFNVIYFLANLRQGQNTIIIVPNPSTGKNNMTGSVIIYVIPIALVGIFFLIFWVLRRSKK